MKPEKFAFIGKKQIDTKKGQKNVIVAVSSYEYLVRIFTDMPLSDISFSPLEDLTDLINCRYYNGQRYLSL